MRQRAARWDAVLRRVLECTDGARLSLLSETPAAELKKRYGLSVFVETGCENGAGLLQARKLGFSLLWSCDLNPEAVDRCKHLASVHLMDSRTFLVGLNSANPFPTLYWLDSHFPERFGADGDKWPLLQELKILAAKSGIENDCVIADDMHCIQNADNPTRESGGGEDWEPVEGSIAELKAVLAKTHTATVYSIGTGLLVFEPKRKEQIPEVSEMSRVAEFIRPYLQPRACGVELGYGGWALSPNLIAMDQWAKYTNFRDDPQHLYGDARDLYWFANGVLDVIAHAHILEDFPDPVPVLREWIRVLKPGGLMASYLPDEQKYRAVCAATGQSYNSSHQCAEMGLAYLKPILESLGLVTIFERDEIDSGSYGFLIISARPMTLDAPDSLKQVEEFGNRVKPWIAIVQPEHSDAMAMTRWLTERYGYKQMSENTYWLQV